MSGRRQAAPQAPRRQDVAVNELLLDPKNPRLPEELQGADQAIILRYLYDEAVLDELIQSFSDNGYFEHEPLIAYQDRNVGGWIVLEGNRRLAALKILLGEPDALDEGLHPQLEAPAPARRLRELRVVPVYEVADRDEVHRYLGYRHIGGIKTWSAEAKARYLLIETDRAQEQQVKNPFLEVARRVGSNSRGVRTSYTAIAVLRHARDEYGLNVKEVLERRFGVWLRCMSAKDIRGYIGLDSGRTYEEVWRDIESVEPDQLGEVIGDLSSRGSRPPLVRDSRQVTTYGLILRNPPARKALRRYDDFVVAAQIVETAELPTRILQLKSQVDVALEEAQGAEPSEELFAAAEALYGAARSLRATVRGLEEE